MISRHFPLRVDLHVKNPTDAERHLSEAKGEYKKLDNQPGDGDSRVDRISFSVGKTSTDIIMDGDTIIERFSASNGDTQVAEYILNPGDKKTGFGDHLGSLVNGPKPRISGMEVLATEDGEVAGRELRLSTAGSNFYSYDLASQSKATSAFVRLNSMFDDQPTA